MGCFLVTASQYFAFTMQNISQRLRCSTTPVSTFPLRCRDTHRPAKPSPLFTSQNRTQPGLCNSRPSGALPLRCYASPYSAFPLLRNAQLSCAVAVLFNSLPFLCNATQGRARRTQAFAVLGQAALSSAIAPPGTAHPRRCFVRRAYQPAFSSGKKFASSVMRPNFSAVPPRLFPSSSSIL